MRAAKCLQDQLRGLLGSDEHRPDGDREEHSGDSVPEGRSSSAGSESAGRLPD